MPTWIWPENCPNENAYARFEDSFMLMDAAPVTALVSVSGEYVLFVNDQLAGFGQYSDWPERRAVNTHDMTALCHAGENRLTLAAWHQNLDCSVDVACPARAWFEVAQGGATLLESRADTPCHADLHYRQGPMWLITPQLGYGFEYDARISQSAPGRAIEVAAPAQMQPRPIPQLALGKCREGTLCSQGVYWDTASSAPIAVRMRRAALSMRFIEELRGENGWLCADEGDGIYLVVDLGQETAGYLHLEADFDADTEVLIGYGEHLQDLRVRTDIDGRSFAARYCAKAGHNEFTHWFRRWGGRYLQLHIAAKRVRIHQVGLLPVDYPSQETRPFPGHDLLHKRIYDTCCRTLKLCMHSHYEDTPWREQALYAMDSRLQMLSGYYAFGETAMPRESLRLLARSQREDGLLELCAPAKVSITIPVFSLHFINAVWEYVQHIGDRAFGAEMMPVIRRILTAFALRCDAQGRLRCFTEAKYWNFFEWQPGLDGGEIHAAQNHTPRLEGPLTACYALAMEAAQHLCAATGCDLGDLEIKRQQAVAGLRTFWNAEKGLFAAFIEEGEQTVYASLMQSLALLCGAAEGEQAHVLRAKMAADEGLIPVTLSNALFRYQALLQDEAAYLPFVFDEIGRVWGNMLFEGATSVWETALGEKDFHNAGSLCHAWSAIPVYFYHVYAQKNRQNNLDA